MHLKKNDYLELFDNPQGERVLNDLSDFCNMNTDGFSETKNKMAYLAGRRSVFLHIERMKEKMNQEIKTTAEE